MFFKNLLKKTEDVLLKTGASPISSEEQTFEKLKVTE
jgi:hypothetical protein